MRVLLVLILAVAVWACSPVYIPATRNVPLFRDAGELQLSGFLTSGGFEGQAAYALTDALFITGNYAYGSSERTNPDYTRKNRYGELGLGYYRASRHRRVEVLAGYGTGKGTSYDQYYFFGLNNALVTTATMNRFFLQPSIGTNGRNLNVAFTPRVAWVDFTSFQSYTQLVEPNEKFQLFFEPSFTTKIHLVGNIKGVLQLGLALPMPSPIYFDYQPLQAAIGVQIDTGNRLRTKVY